MIYIMIKRKTSLIVVSALFLLSLFFPFESFADEVEELKNEVRLLKQMFQAEVKKREALEEKVNAVEGRSVRLEQAVQDDTARHTHFDLADPENPLSISGGVTSVIQGSSGNKSIPDGTNDRTAISFTVDLGLNARLAEHHRVFLDLEAGIGDGLNDRPGGVGAVSSIIYEPYITSGAIGKNGNLLTSLTVSTIYWVGDFLNERLVVSAGKLDPHGYWDENAYANDETTQFLSSLFVRGSGTLHPEAQNYYAPSLVVQYALNDYIDLTWVSVSSDFNDLFVNMEQVGQITLKPHFIEGLDGNYRFFYVNDSRVYNDIVTGQRKNGYSAGISADQQITENIGIYGRYEFLNDKVSFPGGTGVLSFWSAGIDLAGALWGREHDHIGISYGSLSFNKKILRRRDEDHFEAYYNAEVLAGLHLSPHYQYIKNVLGVSSYRSLSAFGVRGQFDF